MVQAEGKLLEDGLEEGELVALGQRTSLYAPFRVLGLVTCEGSGRMLGGTSSPKPCFYELGIAPFVVVPLGRCLQLYDGRTLRLLSLSNALPSRITAVAHLGRERLVVATQHSLHITEQLRSRVSIETAPGGCIVGLYAFGNGVFVAVDAGERCARTYNRDNELVSEVFFGEDITPNGLIVHPPTMLDVVCIGSDQGRIALVDICHSRILQTLDFSKHGAVTALSESPALDIIGMGFHDGSVIIYDIGRGSILDQYNLRMHLPLGTSLTVNALCFRNDDANAFPHLFSFHSDGSLCIYDLEARRVLDTIPRLHRGPCRMAFFYPREPILLTIGDEDNRMNMFICDSPSGAPRLLKYRAGHRAPPTRIRFIGEDYRQLISAGCSDQQLRVTSTVVSHHHRELSQVTTRLRRARKRARQMQHERAIEASDEFALDEDDPDTASLLPPVTDFAVSEARQNDPDLANLVTCHLGRSEAYTWRYAENHRYRHVLRFRGDASTDLDQGTATCVSISTCGHFAAVGLSVGHVDLFNLQSGLHRWRIRDAHHPGGVAGVAFDGSGGLLASLGSHDGRLGIYRHQSREKVADIVVHSPGLQLIWSPVSDLLAVSCADDFSIKVFEAASGRCVRWLRGHAARITDICFSCQADGRQILSTSLDGTLRTWDLVAGRCVDVLRMAAAPTSCAMSPRGDFIVTTHVGHIGICMWHCKAYYRGPSEQGNMVALSSRAGNGLDVEALWRRHAVQLPDLAMSWDPVVSAVADATASPENNPRCVSLTVEPIDDAHCGVVFSSQPESYWLLLPYLDEIKEQNKATRESDSVTGTQKPPPPLVAELHDGYREAADASVSPGIEDRRPLPDSIASSFVDALQRADFATAAKRLDALTPAAADVEIRLLPAEALADALSFFTWRLQSERDFELAQAQLRVFLNEHAELIMKEPALQHGASKCLRALDSSWLRCEDTLSKVLFLCQYLRDSV